FGRVAKRRYRFSHLVAKQLCDLSGLHLLLPQPREGLRELVPLLHGIVDLVRGREPSIKIQWCELVQLVCDREHPGVGHRLPERRASRRVIEFAKMEVGNVSNNWIAE